MDSEGIINSLKNIELNSSNHLFIQSLNGVLMDKKEINDEVYNLCTLLESHIQFNNKDKILERFKAISCDLNKDIVFSCGSGVTASVLALAYSLIDNKYMPTIYDGSWSEYGKE